ncbi:MAG: peptide chain release factor N(5)-glutamine methyltransferase [Candidatus Magasanikbacteria bacterium]|nr:peptide chain release factor N(5)-glutamine methyltransferase [Candidatus Magasanikbacteria bacterium]
MSISDLRKKYQTFPTLDFDLLLADTIKKPKEFLYSHPEYKLSLVEHIRLRYAIFLYKKGYSVAAIIGHKEFYNLDFFVNKHVLVPRPDTELMVDEAIKVLSHEMETKNTNIIYIDVGTGSGCIPISVACHAELVSASREIPKQVRDDIQIFATDISKKALKVAKKNAKMHKVNIDFLHGNLLEPILKNPFLLGTPCFVTITANLPYLTAAQFKSEPSIQREPKNALVAQYNGLDLYIKLLNQIRKLPNSCQMFLFLEIDPSQSEAITKILNKLLPKANVKIKKDLAGLDRLVIAQV